MVNIRAIYNASSFIFNISQRKSPEIEVSENILKSPKYPEESYSYIETTTQIIDQLTSNDWSWFALNKLWCSGSGVPSNPYIIDGLLIDVSATGGNALIINNSIGISFEIRNCKFTKAQSGSLNAGLVLENTNGGKIINCNISDNAWYGIYLINSDNNEFQNCIIKDICATTNTAGLFLQNDCDNNIIRGCYFENVEYSIRMGYTSGCLNTIIEGNTIIKSATISTDNAGIYIYTGCDNTIVRNNIINDLDSTGNRYGIYIYNTDDSMITNNIILGHTYDGIYAYDCDNLAINYNTIKLNGQQGIQASLCWNVTINDNTLEENEGEGVYLYRSDDSFIFHNQVNKNDAPSSESGIHIEDSHGIVIKSNTITNNNYDGIYVDDISISGGIHILDNIIEDNGQYGIRVLSASTLNIINNYIHNSSMYAGLYIYSVNNAIISQNTIIDNRDNVDGVELYACDYAIFSNNIVKNIRHNGLWLYQSDYCSISNNLFENIGLYGISMDDDIGHNQVDSNIIRGCADSGLLIDGTIGIAQNMIANNQFISNDYGIKIGADGDYNIFVYNAFVDNNHSIYESNALGNRLEFNYFDDYSGVDKNGDGIGDTPYDVEGNPSIDPYPLIKNPFEEDLSPESDGETDDDDDDDEKEDEEEEIPDMTSIGLTLLIVGLFSGSVVLYIILKRRDVRK